MARRFSLFRRRFRSWFFAVTAASALVIAAGPAAATDVDQDRIDDALELVAERNVVYRGTPNIAPVSMRVSSQSVGSPTQDWFRVQYEAGEFGVEYVRESSMGLVTSFFTLELRNLVEWSDENADGILQDSEILSTRTLGSSAFGGKPIEHWGNASEDGGVVHTIQITSAANDVILVLTIAKRFYRISAKHTLTPMEMKIDVTIDHVLAYPGARLGLGVRLETDFDVAYESRSWADANGFSQDESAVNVTAGRDPDLAAVFFSWANNATVDGVSGRVTVMGPAQDFESSAYDMVLAYPPGTNPNRVLVHHDPSLGVVSAAYGSILNPPPPPLVPNALLYAASLAGVGAIVAGTMFFANRRRRKE